MTAMCKAKAGMVLDEVARTAVLLFGGNGRKQLIFPDEIFD
jgi:hypothetical protein